MTTIIQKLIQFFNFTGSVSSDLDSYITSKNPQNVADVERLTVQYLSRGICGRTV